MLTGGKVVIRHSTNTNATFATAASLTSVAGSATSANVPAITGKYFAVFENILGVQSTTPASVLFTANAGNQILILIGKKILIIQHSKVLSQMLKNIVHLIMELH